MVNKNYEGETKSERLVRNALEKAAIPFRQEVEVAGVHVDFIIDDTIAVEVDGYTHLASDVRIRDIKKQQLLEDKGYYLMRLASEDAKDKRLLSAFILAVKHHLNSVKKVMGDPFLNRPLDTHSMKEYKTSLEVQSKRNKVDESNSDEVLFRQWVERIPRDKKKK